jgi:hypothetical protein
MKRPFLLWKRGKVWYYKLPNIKHYLSTGQTTRKAAENYILDILNKERASVPKRGSGSVDSISSGRQTTGMKQQSLFLLQLVLFLCSNRV